MQELGEQLHDYTCYTSIINSLPKPACCIASSSHFHVVGISVSETVLDTDLRLDGTPEHQRTQIVVCPMYIQRAKKVMSDSLGLVDFAIGLVNSVFNLPDGQVIFFEQLE